MTIRNPIIEEDERDEYETEAGATSDDTDYESEDQFEGDEPEEFTDAEAVEQLRTQDEREVSQANKPRVRARANEREPSRSRETPSQATSKQRKPVREREYVWGPGESLDAPPPLPGMDQRWIRHRLGPDEDPKNWISKKRGMWVPRPADSVPDSFAPPTMQHGSLGTIIGVGDLILCQRPLGMSIARRKYFRTKQLRQTEAGQRHVRSVERQDHPISVTQKQDMRPTVGRGAKRRVTVQDGSDE